MDNERIKYIVILGILPVVVALAVIVAWAPISGYLDMREFLQ